MSLFLAGHSGKRHSYRFSATRQFNHFTAKRFNFPQCGGVVSPSSGRDASRRVRCDANGLTTRSTGKFSDRIYRIHRIGGRSESCKSCQSHEVGLTRRVAPRRVRNQRKQQGQLQGQLSWDARANLPAPIPKSGCRMNGTLVLGEGSRGRVSPRTFYMVVLDVVSVVSQSS